MHANMYTYNFDMKTEKMKIPATIIFITLPRMGKQNKQARKDFNDFVLKSKSMQP